MQNQEQVKKLLARSIIDLCKERLDQQGLFSITGQVDIITGSNQKLHVNIRHSSDCNKTSIFGSGDGEKVIPGNGDTSTLFQVCPDQKSLCAVCKKRWALTEPVLKHVEEEQMCIFRKKEVSTKNNVLKLNCKQGRVTNSIFSNNTKNPSTVAMKDNHGSNHDGDFLAGNSSFGTLSFSGQDADTDDLTQDSSSVGSHGVVNMVNSEPGTHFKNDKRSDGHEADIKLENNGELMVHLRSHHKDVTDDILSEFHPNFHKSGQVGMLQECCPLEMSVVKVEKREYSDFDERIDLSCPSQSLCHTLQCGPTTRPAMDQRSGETRMDHNGEREHRQTEHRKGSMWKDAERDGKGRRIMACGQARSEEATWKQCSRTEETVSGQVESADSMQTPCHSFNQTELEQLHSPDLSNSKSRQTFQLSMDDTSSYINILADTPPSSGHTSVYNKRYASKHKSTSAGPLSTTTNGTRAKKSATGHKKYHMCKTCGKAFAKANNLKKHEYIHTGEKPYVCGTCGKGFTQPGSLKRHELTHTGERPHVCETCGRAFAGIMDLKRHWVTHSGEKPYVCGTCGYRCKRASYLKEHEYTHAVARPHVCSICGRGFTRAYYLKIHEYNHTGQKTYVCQTCGMGFNRESTLKRHQNRHTGMKPHICNMCGKGFTEKSTLKRHVHIHTGSKIYVCETCGKRFTEASTLRRHVNNTHAGHSTDIH